jgi:hypothetical protein
VVENYENNAISTNDHCKEYGYTQSNESNKRRTGPVLPRCVKAEARLVEGTAVGIH